MFQERLVKNITYTNFNYTELRWVLRNVTEKYRNIYLQSVNNKNVNRGGKVTDSRALNVSRAGVIDCSTKQ